MSVEEELLLSVKELWDEGRFYEAHELLEDIWRLFPKEDKLSRNCYQGIIRLAIALYHYNSGKKDSALRVLYKVKPQLEACPKTFRYVDTSLLLSFVMSCIKALEEGREIESFVAFPIIKYFYEFENL